jgi:L1 cell adhesion molecule like protein
MATTAVDPAKAKAAKEQGNKAFKKGNYLLAVKHFTESIRHDVTNKASYSNRAAAYTQLGRKDKSFYDLAIVDAKKCTELQTSWGKGYQRWGTALMLKGDFTDAIGVFALGIAADPTNANLTKGLQDAQKKMKAKADVTAKVEKMKKQAEQKKATKTPVTGEVVIGIDLGTTNSCVAVWRDQGVEIIANKLGDRTTPSWVAFNKEGERLVGAAARNQAAANPENTFFDVKRIIGQRFDAEGVSQDCSHFPFGVAAGSSDQPVLSCKVGADTRQFAPEQISAFVLQHLKTYSEAYLGHPVSKAVITVPAYFNDAQRNATKAAGRIAGLDVLRIINEPTAAALAYGLDVHTEGKTNLLIFDLGGGTFDVTILSIENGIFEVKATGGDTRLGGEDFDQTVVDFLLKECKKKGMPDVAKSARALRRLRVAAEQAKRTLSNGTTADIEVESLSDGQDFSFKLSRAKFEQLNKASFARCMETVKRVMKDAAMKSDDISEVVLVGGSTRIPRLQKLLQDNFGGRELCKTLNPDEAVAYGAAIQGAIMSGHRSSKTKDLLLMDVTPLSLGIETTGRVMSVIIPRNTQIPCSRTQTYTTEDDYQTQVDVCVYEGEHLRTERNNMLGKFTISGIKRAKRGEPQVDVTFALNADGILEVTAVDRDTGVEANIKIENKQTTSEEEIQRMLKEAEVFRKQDEENIRARESLNELERTIFEVMEAAKDSTDKRLAKVLRKAAADTQEWLEDNPTATSSAIELRRRELARRLQTRRSKQSRQTAEEAAMM